MLDPDEVSRRSLRSSSDYLTIVCGPNAIVFVSWWRHGETRVLVHENDRYDAWISDLERSLCSFSLHTDSHHRCKEDEGLMIEGEKERARERGRKEALKNEEDDEE